MTTTTEWEILIPEAGTNLLAVPSWEIDYPLLSAPFTAIIGAETIARTGGGRRGIYAVHTTPVANAYSGVSSLTVSLTVGTTYTATVDVKGAAGIPMRLYIADAGTAEGTPTTWTGDGTWMRKSVTWTCDASKSYTVRVSKNNDASLTAFDTDGWMLQAVAYETSFIDGSQPGCVWNGLMERDTSTRSEQTRAGGKIVNLGAANIRVLYNDGIGMPPITTQIQPRPLQHGVSYRGYKVQPRYLTLEISPDTSPATSDALHAIRKDVIDYIKADVIEGGQPMRLRYKGAKDTNPVWIDAIYTGGYEFAARNKVEVQDLQFFCPDPFWREDGDVGSTLSVEVGTANYNYVAEWQRVGNFSGWNNMHEPSSGATIRSMCHTTTSSPLGYPLTFIGGDFTNWDGNANGDYIVSWNRNTQAYAALGTGMNGVVRVIKQGPDGYIYVGGDFTTANGVTVNRITYWNGTTFVALGGVTKGVDTGGVYDLDWDNTGNLYVVGTFNNAGGGAADSIAKWNGSAWAAVGAGTLTGTGIYSIAIRQSTSIVFVTGSFSAVGGVSAANCAYFGEEPAAWHAMGSGLNAAGNVVRLMNGVVPYFGGAFTTANGVTVNYITAWGGKPANFWVLGTGMDAAVSAIAFDDEWNLLAGGAFTTAGGVACNRLATWNGSSWTAVAVDLPGSPTVSAIDVEDTGLADYYMWIGWNTAGAVGSLPYSNTVTNTGTAEAYPIFIFKRTGGTSAVLHEITNQTTGKSLTFDELPLTDGDTITIDLSPGGKKITSAKFGNMLTYLNRGSDFGSFSFLPGANTITVWIETAGSPTWASAGVYHPVKHWSADGAAN